MACVGRAAHRARNRCGASVLVGQLPPEQYWDEQYYVLDAAAYLGGGIGQPVGERPPETIADEGTWVHPPMGKWMIALLGVGPIGSLHPLGWRLPAVLFGVAGVGVLYLLALRLWRSVWWAGLAALLLALDGLHIVQSRMAMLDIFLSTFIVTGVLFLVLDHERTTLTGRHSTWRRTERWFGSPYRFWSGVFLGAAVATKWSGIFALGFAIVLAVVWAGRARGEEPAARRSILLSFVVVPIAVYLASYATFFWQHGPDAGGFLTLQWRMLEYHLHHHKVQPENSAPWTWPLLLHPIQYFEHISGGSVQRIMALGNPVLWWGFLALLPVAALTVARKPTWQDAVAFGGYATLFVPWFFVGRNQFFFYALPMVPFMALCVVATLRRLSPATGRAIGIAGAVAAVVVTVAFAPLWLGLQVPAGWLDALAWLPGWRT